MGADGSQEPRDRWRAMFCDWIDPAMYKLGLVGGHGTYHWPDPAHHVDVRFVQSSSIDDDIDYFDVGLGDVGVLTDLLGRSGELTWERGEPIEPLARLIIEGVQRFAPFPPNSAPAWDPSLVDARESYKRMLRDEVAPALRDAGFKGSSGHFRIYEAQHELWFNFRKDARGSTRRCALFGVLITVMRDGRGVWGVDMFPHLTGLSGDSGIAIGQPTGPIARVVIDTILEVGLPAARLAARRASGEAVTIYPDFEADLMTVENEAVEAHFSYMRRRSHSEPPAIPLNTQLERLERLARKVAAMITTAAESSPMEGSPDKPEWANRWLSQQMLRVADSAHAALDDWDLLSRPPGESDRQPAQRYAPLEGRIGWQLMKARTTSARLVDVFIGRWRATGRTSWSDR